MSLIVLLLLTVLSGPGVTASKENIAAGAKAVQSSTGNDLGHAENAVDGDDDANARRGSCTFTKSEANPWWRVELPGVYNITCVTITNRGDCCGERIHGAQIRIGNSLKNNGNKNKLIAVVGPLKLGATRTYRFKATEGRFVNIFLPGEEKILSLCEVKVFSDKAFLHIHGNIALRATT
ncbi:fucolectin-like, partial [Salminus brasiliensis]|uniref:fucolectin-like n=1 Tax=Salminus brasiliensis TaxID=930266 RepID=UPI003B832468